MTEPTYDDFFPDAKKFFDVVSKNILGNQDESAVLNFIDSLKQHPVFSFIFLSIDFSVTQDELQKWEGGIRASQQLKRLLAESVFTEKENLRNELDVLISELTVRVAENQSLKTGGRRTRLSAMDVSFLGILRGAFRQHFPTQSGDFKRDNLLHQLGVELLKKPIPQSVNKMIDEQTTIILGAE